jgi:hypothetical protein
MLTRVARDAERALQAVELSDGLLAHEHVADAQRLLPELIGQDFEMDEVGVPSATKGF